MGEGNNQYQNGYEPKKNNNSLIVLLLVIILILTGYIIYDKVISKSDKKENINNNENNNTEMNNNQNNNENKQEESKTLVKTIPFEKNVNEKKVELDYKIYVENVDLGGVKDPTVIVEFYINGAKKSEWKEAVFPAGIDGIEPTEAEKEQVNDFIQNFELNLASYHGILNADKEYLYVFVNDFIPNTLLIINENGEELASESIIPNSAKAYATPERDCQKYEQYGEKSYFIDTDAIYYLKPSKVDETTDEWVTYANEYKLTVSENVVEKEKFNTCKALIGGWDDEITFEDEA